MPQEGARRRRKPHHYDVVVVPVREGARSTTFRTSRLKIALLAIVGFLACVGITLAVLMYTPVAMYVPIPNPALEQKYGRQIVETQQKLNELAEDVLLLRDYNTQLRKALGEGSSKDSSRFGSPSIVLDDRHHGQYAESSPGRPVPDQTNNQRADEVTGVEEEPYNVILDGSGQVQASFPLVTPTDGFVTQGFDPESRHFGMDFAAKQGTPVYAAADGYVVFAGWTYDDGNMIMLSHGGGYLTVYKHTQLLLKNLQAFVRRGELIALLGTSGNTSLGPHLHFEVWKDGIPQDPNEYLLTPTKVQ